MVQAKIQIIDEMTGEVLASHPSDSNPTFVLKMQAGGAIYLVDERSPGRRSLTRIDAVGAQDIEFDSIGWIDFRSGGPVPAIFVRGVNEDQSQLHLLNNDGSVLTLTFDDGVFVKMHHGRIIVADAQHSGDIWLLNPDFDPIDSRRLGQLQNIPILQEDGRLSINRDGERHRVDPTTWEATSNVATSTEIDGINVYAYGEYRAEVADGTLWVVDTSTGDVLAETLVGEFRDVSAFEHPDGSHALVAVRTCRSEEGDVCQSEEPPASTSGSGDEGDDSVSDEPFVSPAYLDLYRFDIVDGTIVRLDTPRFTSVSVHAWNDGWLAAGVDGSTTTIFSIDGAEIAVAEEVPNGGQYWTGEYVLPVGQSSLALVDWASSELFLATPEGVVTRPGVLPRDAEAWLIHSDNFAQLG